MTPTERKPRFITFPPLSTRREEYFFAIKITKEFLKAVFDKNERFQRYEVGPFKTESKL